MTQYNTLNVKLSTSFGLLTAMSATDAAIQKKFMDQELLH